MCENSKEKLNHQYEEEQQSETCNAENLTQFILDENKQVIEIPKELCKEVTHPAKYKIQNAFEVFVRVNGTENYWISNYGRGMNNLDKNHFYEHKQGKCHYTVYEIEKYISSVPVTRYKNGRVKLHEDKRKTVTRLSLSLSDEECNSILNELQNEDRKKLYSIETTRYRKETSPEKLVAEHFLIKNRKGDKIWHKDGDLSNNWYKNLLWVTAKEYKDLQNGKISWGEMTPKQEYNEYVNKATASAYIVYNGIRARCSNPTDSDNIRSCYRDATMCQEWLDDPKAFVRWYFEHYYEVDGESVAVDKDLFGDGSMMYSPDTCCILPQTLNNLIVNCKKSYLKEQTREDVLPLGVRKTKNGYRGEIMLTGTNEVLLLSEWNTPEEAFAEYKVMKQADIKLIALKYKDKIPEYIYSKLLEIEVKPY